MDYATITVDGTLLDKWQPKGSTFGDGGHCTVSRCVTVDADVVRQIDAAEAGGIRRILLVVDSFGGYSISAYTVAARIERFREDGGFVVAFVRVADSSAPVVAVAADHVVLAPDGRFALHAAGKPGDDPAYLHGLHETMGAALAQRTGLTAESLTELLDGGHELFILTGTRATAWCFADEVGTLERAREVAAGADRPASERFRRLAALVGLAACATLACGGATMSSESGFVGKPWISSREQAERIAIRALTMRSTTGGLYGVAYGSAGFIAVGVSSTCLKSRTGEEFTTSPITSGSYRAITYDTAHDRYIAVGLSSACSVTADGGASWSAKTIPAGSYKAATVHGSRVIAAGDSGVVATTDNGGDTWTSRTFGRALSISGIASNGSRVVAVGLNVSDGFASYSDDGQTWTAHDFPTYAESGFMPVAVTATPHGWVSVGSGGGVMTWTGNTSDPWVKRVLPQEAALAAAICTETLVVAIESAPDADKTFMFAAAQNGVAWDVTCELIPRRGFNAGAWSGHVLCLVGSGIATSTSVF